MTIPSPCINVCRMDQATGLCSGCFRTLDEIVRWSRASDDEKLQVLSAVSKRRGEFDPWGDELRGECER